MSQVFVLMSLVPQQETLERHRVSPSPWRSWNMHSIDLNTAHLQRKTGEVCENSEADILFPLELPLLFVCSIPVVFTLPQMWREPCILSPQADRVKGRYSGFVLLHSLFCNCSFWKVRRSGEKRARTKSWTNSWSWEGTSLTRPISILMVSQKKSSANGCQSKWNLPFDWIWHRVTQHVKFWGHIPFCRRGNRDDMVIATKCRANMKPSSPNCAGLSRKHILEAVDASLKRLQTDYIDLYQVLQPIIIPNTQSSVDNRQGYFKSDKWEVCKGYRNLSNFRLCAPLKRFQHR